MTVDLIKNQHDCRVSVFPALEQVEPDTKTRIQRNVRKPDIASILSEETSKISEAEIRVSTLSVHNIHEHGNLFTNYLKARRDVFIVQKGWNLPEVDGMEFDQYDTPLARWVILHEYGEVLAGIRLTPTTARCAQYTYMIRDAQLGLLKDIPRDILYMEAPVKDEIWEATRLFVSARVSASRRSRIQTLLMVGMAASARELGISHIIGIVPSVFHRWMKRIGMSAEAIGPLLEIEGDRTQAAMMDVRQPIARPA